MREYRLQISPRMLELLSRDLYSSIYFVLAELIANAYDADACNVFITFCKEEIRVEDDGTGMSENELDEYLNVGAISRTNSDNSNTKGKNRVKMGRKGVGKLAGLSISDSFKVISRKNGSTNGFIVPKSIDSDDYCLKTLTEDQLHLEHVKDHGTGIIMPNPNIDFPKSIDTIVNNLSRIFPKIDEEFKIHIEYVRDSEKVERKTVEWDDELFVKSLSTIIRIGNSENSLRDIDLSTTDILEKTTSIKPKLLQIPDKDGITREFLLKIEGWIATYKSTAGLKKEPDEFSRNYLAIYSHKKMGQRNILNVVSRNRVFESYIVGQLHIDLFEESTLPDMAMTNRQGYREDDIRWVEAIKQIWELTKEISQLHANYTAKKKSKDTKKKEESKRQKEEELTKLSKTAVASATADMQKSIEKKEPIEKTAQIGTNAIMSTMGLKTEVDANKKKILISQSESDKPVSDLIYHMLIFNGVPKEDIIYSNGDDPETNLPERDLYEYLRKFFIKSSSTEMIYVLFVVSKKSIAEKDWANVLLEVGAGWVTRRDHWVFSINGFPPKEPLDLQDKWVNLELDYDTEIIHIGSRSVLNSFCKKIIMTVEEIGCNAKSFESNIVELEKGVIIKRK